MMAINITLSGNYTLDETSGIQTGADGTPSGTPRPDSDVTLATLQAQAASFYNYLFTTLALSTTFPSGVGVGASASNLINVSADAALSSLGLTDSDGDAFDGTQSSNIFTTSGKEIFLVSDDIGGVDNQVVLGKYDSDGNGSLDAVAFAVYMQPDGALDSNVNVKLWSVTFTALDHSVSGSDTQALDDPIDLLALVSITATGSKTFNFDALPSGQNLFGIVGDLEDAIVVCGELPVLKADGSYTNTSDTINTSKGGGPTTIGVDNQSFDPVGGGTDVNDGAFFTYVEDPDPRYLAGVSGGLNQNEADLAGNVLFGNTKEVDGAFLKIVQVVGNDLASLSLTAWNLTNNAQDGRPFIENGMGSEGGSKVNITSVQVYNGSIDPANLVTSGITISIVNGVASISGLQDGMLVVWNTAGDHDQVQVQANSGSGAFDIGLFGLIDGEEESESLAGRSFVEDDGPSVGPIDNGTVLFQSGQFVSKLLNDAAGTDEMATLKITDFTSSVTLTDVTLTGVINTDQTQVKYFEDKNANGTFEPGTDVHYYTLDITQLASGNSYTFTVVNAPPAPPLTFDFDNLPSGQNLFGSVADSASGPGIFVFGADPVLKSGPGTYANTSDTINTSQGGLGATIGVNNQMFDGDAGEGAYFTFVVDVDDRYLSGIEGGLDQGEADDADFLLYGGGLKNTDGAFLGISQIQGNSLASMKLTCIDLDDDYQGRDLISNRGGNGDDEVNITRVIIFDAAGNELEDSDGSSSHADISIDLSGNTAVITGLNAGYRVEWETGGATHNQVLVEATAGKFDIGFFGINEDQQVPDHILEFDVTITDRDGDTDLGSWQVTVDNPLV